MDLKWNNAFIRKINDPVNIFYPSSGGKVHTGKEFNEVILDYWKLLIILPLFSNVNVDRRIQCEHSFKKLVSYQSVWIWKIESHKNFNGIFFKSI